MITSKSPRKVLKLAYTLGVEVLPKYFSPFSRHAFTKPQLFACLVLREHQKKGFRGIEAGKLGTATYFASVYLALAATGNHRYRQRHLNPSQRRSFRPAGRRHKRSFKLAISNARSRRIYYIVNSM